MHKKCKRKEYLKAMAMNVWLKYAVWSEKWDRDTVAYIASI